MLKKCISYLVICLFVFSLVIPAAASVEMKDKISMPNMTFFEIRDTACGITSTKLYVKDGQIYVDSGGQLYAMDVLLDTIMPMLKGLLQDVLDTFEIRELGEEFIDGHRTMHYQILSKKTGMVEYEIWQALDLPFPLDLKRVSYDSQGRALSSTRIIDIEFEPDFSEIDFARASAFPMFEGPRRALSLTADEFKVMVPWYDLAEKPLPDYELSHIEYVATFGTLEYILTYTGDDGQHQVMIYGAPGKLGETHGPSEFELLQWARFNDFTLQPVVRSSRSGVMVGFTTPIERSDGNIFLKNVVIHPTLQ